MPAIIPGINDFMSDNDKSADGKRAKVKRSRGVRGAGEFAAACKHALQCCETGRIRDLDEEDTQPHVFDRCAISSMDKEYYKRNSDAKMVLEQAQVQARELSLRPWTPLIHVATPMTDRAQAARMESIERAKEQANTLSKALLQKKGWNVDG